MQRASNRDLYQIAEAQGGYFTARQAAGLGYTAGKGNYHVGPGNWAREHRGIYRLALFPSPPRPDLILWWLWSRGRSDSLQGDFSHHTALALHELTEANPAGTDLTVPPTFRKGSEIPPVLRLHFAESLSTPGAQTPRRGSGQTRLRRGTKLGYLLTSGHGPFCSSAPSPRMQGDRMNHRCNNGVGPSQPVPFSRTIRRCLY